MMKSIFIIQKLCKTIQYNVSPKQFTYLILTIIIIIQEKEKILCRKLKLQKMKIYILFNSNLLLKLIKNLF